MRVTKIIIGFMVGLSFCVLLAHDEYWYVTGYNQVVPVTASREQIEMWTRPVAFWPQVYDWIEPIPIEWPYYLAFDDVTDEDVSGAIQASMDIWNAQVPDELNYTMFEEVFDDGVMFVPTPSSSPLLNSNTPGKSYLTYGAWGIL